MEIKEIQDKYHFSDELMGKLRHSIDVLRRGKDL